MQSNEPWEEMDDRNHQDQEQLDELYGPFEMLCLIFGDSIIRNYNAFCERKKKAKQEMNRGAMLTNHRLSL